MTHPVSPFLSPFLPPGPSRRRTVPDREPADRPPGVRETAAVPRVQELGGGALLPLQRGGEDSRLALQGGEEEMGRPLGPAGRELMQPEAG